MQKVTSVVQRCLPLIHQLLISSLTLLHDSISIRPPSLTAPAPVSHSTCYPHPYLTLKINHLNNQIPPLSTSQRRHHPIFSFTLELGGGASFNLGSGFIRNSSCTDRDMEIEEDDELGVCSDESSSTVGSRSDSSDDEEWEDDERSCKESVETTDALQQVPPVRKGISKFYCGKSKSFTSLADAVSSASVKELAKPETLYSRKQNNLLAHKIPDYKQFNSLRSNPGGHLNKFDPSNESCSSSVSPPLCLPPLHPQRKKIQNPGSSVSPPRQKCSPWRSFSVSDLQGMVHHA